jgi:hypothetical protein
MDELHVAAANARHIAAVQSWARMAGVLGLLSVVAGGFGEAYVPAALVVPQDASATASNILAREWLLRFGGYGD